jgi:hypothetical protein
MLESLDTGQLGVHLLRGDSARDQAAGSGWNY